MAPLTDVLIAKIVLGYLSSRKLLKTSDCFLKESEALNTDTACHNKGRILNHLQDQNLLPSLEDILHDYFAYNEADNSASDKTYQLWKQLDVVISQLRGISLGKKKAKAFLRTRKSGNTLHQVFSKRENDCDISELFMSKQTNQYPQENESQIKPLEQQTNSPDHSATWTHRTPAASPFKGAQFTPRKEHLITESLKTFKSPKRKSHHPKRRSNPQFDPSVKKVDFTPIKPSENDSNMLQTIKPSENSNISPILVNEEFNHIVEMLMGSNTFTEKLADNINKVVNSDAKKETKETKENDKDPVNIQEVYKLTTHDPDLCDLLAIFGEFNDITEDDSHAAMETHKTPATMEMNKSPATMETNKIPATMETNKSPATMETNKSPATMETNKSPATMETNKTPATMETNKSPATMETNKTSPTMETNKTSHNCQMSHLDSNDLNTFSNDDDDDNVDLPYLSITPQESQIVQSSYEQDTLRLCPSKNTSVTSQSVISQLAATTTKSNDEQNICSAVTSSIPFTSSDNMAEIEVASSSNKTMKLAPHSFVMDTSPLFYTKLLNSDSNEFPNCNDTAVMASCIRNLQQEINICSSTDGDPSLSKQLTPYTEPSQTHAAQILSSLERTYSTDAPQCPNSYQLTYNKHLSERQELYLGIDTTTPTPVDLKTPAKDNIMNINQIRQVKSTDEESVSIATDALLLLATSPGKPPPNFEMSCKSGQTQFSFVRELSQPLKDDIAELSGSTSFYDHFGAVSSQLNFNTIPASEISVSDRQALSEPTNLLANPKNNSGVYFEEPHKDLKRKVPILPKDTTKSPSSIVRFVQPPKTIIAKATDMSVSGQLARKGQVIGKKKRKSRASLSENVVTRLLTFESTNLPSSTSLVHPVVIATMQGPEWIKPANSFVYMNCASAISDVSKKELMTPHEVPRCSVNINPTKLNLRSNYQQPPLRNESQTQSSPITSQSSCSKMQKFRIQGSQILTNTAGNRKTPVFSIEQSSLNPVCESNQDNVTLTWTNSLVGDLTTTADSIGSIASTEVKQSITEKSKNPKIRKNSKELKVKFSFKSPKKKSTISNHRFTDITEVMPASTTGISLVNVKHTPDINKANAAVDERNGHTWSSNDSIDLTPTVNDITNADLYCNEEPLVSIKTSPIVSNKYLLNETINEDIQQFFVEHEEDNIDIVFCSETSCNPTPSTHQEYQFHFDSKGLEPRSVQSCSVSETIVTSKNALNNCLKPTASVKPFIQYSLTDSSTQKVLSSSALDLLQTDASQNALISSKKRKLSDTSRDKNEGFVDEQKEQKRQRNLKRLLQMGPDEYLLKMKV